MRRQDPQNDQRLSQAIEQLSRAADDMRASQQAASSQQNGQQQQGSSGQAEADARRAAERLKDAEQALNGMRKQQASSQLGDLSEHAQRLAQQQRDFANRLRQAYGDAMSRDPQTRASMPPASPQQAQQFANEQEKMAGDVEQLEKDMQKAARDMGGTQPAASGKVREALSELQQNEAKSRMKASVPYIRQGQGGYMVSREAPITQTMDQVSEDLKQAQNAIGNQQTPGNGQQNDAARSLAQVERLRGQMEQMAGRGQQPGGQQQGGQQGGGQQGGGQQGGGYRGGGNRQYGGGGFGGRYNTDGFYDLPDGRPVDPARVLHDATAQLNDLRQQYKDNPDVARQIGEVQQEISRLQVGDISSPELQNRINREVLPNLEALEVGLRNQVDNQGDGQVRSGTTDKVPAGYVDAVAEYFRKLSKGK